MDGRFLTAFIIPKEWDVMGYKLKPFSLRHMLILQAIESPFMSSKRPPSCPEDVLVFLRVCSSEHPSKAFRKPTLMDRLRIARMEASIGCFKKQVDACMAYVEMCTSAPKTYTKDDEEVHKKRENVPGPLSLAGSLMSRLHFTQDQAWDCTLGQAIWYLTAHAIAEGAEIRILTTEEEARSESDLTLLKRHQEQALARLKEMRAKNNG
jgi:hypothetical protein